MKINTKSLGNYFGMFQLLVFGLLILALGIKFLILTLPDLAPSRLLPPVEARVLTVNELLARQGPLRVSVRGRFNFDDILVEKEYRGYGNNRANSWNDYFYTLVDEESGEALYVRSDLEPYTFQQQFGAGLVTMPGIWQRPGSDTQLRMSKLWFEVLAHKQMAWHEAEQKTGPASGPENPGSSPAARLARLKERLDQNRWPSSSWVLGRDEPSWGIVLGKVLLVLLSGGILAGGVFFLWLIPHAYRDRHD